jgi:hypothetical protein
MKNMNVIVTVIVIYFTFQISMIGNISFGYRTSHNITQNFLLRNNKLVTIQAKVLCINKKTVDIESCFKLFHITKLVFIFIYKKYKQEYILRL